MKWLKNWIRGIKNTIMYYPVLRKDFDWDYAFLMDLIDFKLKRMAKYFHTHSVLVNEERYAGQMDLAIRLLNIAYKSDAITNKDVEGIKINTRNAKRFIPEELLDGWYRNSEYFLADLRQRKAEKLFWEYVAHNINHWWE